MGYDLADSKTGNIHFHNALHVPLKFQSFLCIEVIIRTSFIFLPFAKIIKHNIASGLILLDSAISDKVPEMAFSPD